MRITTEQFRRWKRYVSGVLRHMTWKKLANMARVEYRLMRNDPDMEGLYPWLLFMEMSHVCNLRCPLCATGLQKQLPRRHLMDFDNYVKVVEPLKERLFLIFLYNLGEPFMNKDIHRIIEWNTKSNIGTVLSSNLNLPVDAEALVKNKLELLIVSGDGVTQEVYERYRVGGKLDKVFQNLDRVVAAKRAAGSSLPYIEWQCLVSRWNEHQMEEIKETVFRKGVDEVRFCNLNYYPVANKEEAYEEWAPKNPEYRMHCSEDASAPEKKGVRRPCYYLWRTAIVNVDGQIAPCCLYDIPSWGDVLKDGFLTVWNNEVYNEARRRSRPGDDGRPKTRLVCDSCKAPFIYK